MLNRLGFPRVGEHRRFVAAIVADTVGSGLFMPITLLYFLAMTDLSLVQIGTALSLSAVLTMPGAFVIGSLVDRFGPRTMMLAGNLVQAVGMIAYLWADSLLVVALWTTLITFAVSLVYNVIGLTLAVQGLFTPIASAIIMPISKDFFVRIVLTLQLGPASSTVDVSGPANLR